MDLREHHEPQADAKFSVSSLATLLTTSPSWLIGESFGLGNLPLSQPLTMAWHEKIAPSVSNTTSNHSMHMWSIRANQTPLFSRRQVQLHGK